jgi:hypothetical protein
VKEKYGDNALDAKGGFLYNPARISNFITILSILILEG